MLIIEPASAGRTKDQDTPVPSSGPGDSTQIQVTRSGWQITGQYCDQALTRVVIRKTDPESEV